MGKGSANLTDPHHTPTIIQPSTQPQKIQKPRKPRKETQVPQPSDPTESVADEAVHKELDDSLVRAATTTSSLEAEQDSGNINKTQSKATPNESSSLGTTSGGSPRCQETMGDTIAQTRFKNVLDLEKTKTTQHNEIASLKRRVKKLEKKNRSRTHKLKRLYKVGLTAKVESSDNEESLGEDASKQGRIDAIDADEEITLVSVHDEMEVDEEVVEVINTTKLIIDAAQVSVVVDKVSTASVVTTVSAATTTTATITTVDDITLAQALEEMKSTKPKKKGVVIQELGESTTTKSSQLSSQDKGKGILVEPVKPMKKKDQISFDEETALKLQDDIHAKIDVDHQLAKRLQAKEQEELFEDFRTELEGKEKIAGTELIQENAKKQKVEDDKETAELKQCLEIIPDEEEVTIDDIPLAVKSPSIVDWKIHKEGRKFYYQIIRADEKSQMYMIFCHMLKSFNSEDLEDLYKLIKAKYESTRPVEDLDLIL
ncbi:hypothetical protein Tco_1006455 [Tanacetum coccineum]|uniref:Uncharacterized protein n=1 Tax=Tanacetum coccineum TaxID=301880 RepID=A0ABQ5FJN4_9ASTR